MILLSVGRLSLSHFSDLNIGQGEDDCIRNGCVM